MNDFERDLIYLYADGEFDTINISILEEEKGGRKPKRGNRWCCVTGVLLSDIISRTQGDYILCGHSLGARVIYYALTSLSTKEEKWIKHVHLLGGAVGNKKKDWEQAANAVDGTIVNYYSEKDMVLATHFKVGTLFSSVPIGKNVIDVDGVVDVNVTEQVTGHTMYKDRFSLFAKT